MSNRIEIENKIWCYNNKIELCNDDIFSIKKEVEKLEQLLDSINQMCSKFIECQDNRINAVKKISRLSVNAKMTDEYYNGMKNLLSGNESSHVANGLQSAKQNVDDKICELRQKIAQKQAEVYDYQNIISGLYNELYTLSDDE